MVGVRGPSTRPPAPACSRPSSTCCPSTRSPENRCSPLATGGSPAHVLALDYALRPVLAALGAHVTQGRFVLDRHAMTAPDGRTTLDPDGELQLGRAIEQFARTLPPHAHLTAV
ncbi:hypothetical protein [Streptomyces huasconensis]|uniref:hypothetical protein n=1 Tax=Streptomyces huasconensis TaxID=1854574 RepID=UPI003714E32F